MRTDGIAARDGSPEMRLRILHLEDDPIDAELVRETLEGSGLACESVRVDDRPGFEAALDAGTFDLILADYSLPSYDGLSAQALARERRPDVPFIFLSGTLGEEIAIERLKEGATDYVLKQRLTRLPAAVRRALKEAAERNDRHRAEAEIRRLNADLEHRVAERTSDLAAANRALQQREAEAKRAEIFLNSIVENIPNMVSVKDAQTLRFLRFNRAGELLLG